MKPMITTNHDIMATARFLMREHKMGTAKVAGILNVSEERVAATAKAWDAYRAEAARVYKGDERGYAIACAHLDGANAGSIAVAHGITRSRVHQILAAWTTRPAAQTPRTASIRRVWPLYLRRVAGQSLTPTEMATLHTYGFRRAPDGKRFRPRWCFAADRQAHRWHEQFCDGTPIAVLAREARCPPMVIQRALWRRGLSYRRDQRQCPK